MVNAATGAIAQRLDYDEFGQVLEDTSPGFQPFGFAGGLYDPDTHLVQFGAREYDPRTGRFTTLEPLGFAQGGNRYTYAGADPINRIDPTGLSWIDWSIWNDLDPVSDAAAGFGDAISFGATRKIRKALDVDEVVSPCSLVYRLAGFAGEMLRDELLGVGVLKLAGRAWRAAGGITMGAKQGRENRVDWLEVNELIRSSMLDALFGELLRSMSADVVSVELPAADAVFMKRRPNRRSTSWVLARGDGRVSVNR